MKLKYLIKGWNNFLEKRKTIQWKKWYLSDNCSCSERNFYKIITEIFTFIFSSSSLLLNLTMVKGPCNLVWKCFEWKFVKNFSIKHKQVLNYFKVVVNFLRPLFVLILIIRNIFVKYPRFFHWFSFHSLNYFFSFTVKANRLDRGLTRLKIHGNLCRIRNWFWWALLT